MKNTQDSVAQEIVKFLEGIFRYSNRPAVWGAISRRFKNKIKDVWPHDIQSFLTKMHQDGLVYEIPCSRSGTYYLPKKLFDECYDELSRINEITLIASFGVQSGQKARQKEAERLEKIRQADMEILNRIKMQNALQDLMKKPDKK